MGALHLPDPARTVRAGIGVCKRAGLNRGQALQLIVVICGDAVLRAAKAGAPDVTWLEQVRAEARRQLAKLPDKTTGAMQGAGGTGRTGA